MYRATGKAAGMGHSYIARLNSFDRTLTAVKVTLCRKGGGIIDSLPFLIRKMKTENYRPTIVLLQIGGNDLDKYLFDQDAFLQKLTVIISDLKSWGVLELGIMNIFSGLIYIYTEAGDLHLTMN